MRISLSIKEWHQMAEQGDAPPVRILLNGNSMFPLVRRNKDYVTIIPFDREPVIGDIVLFYDKKTERYVVHRVWNMCDGQIQTWGDNCERPDAWLPNDCVWGKVNLVERGWRRIIPNPKKGLRWAKFWHGAGRVYRWLGRRWHRIVDRKKRN